MSHTTTTKTPPYDKVTSVDGSIEIPIWRNVNAKGYVNYSMTEPERTYKDKQTGKYKTTTTIFDNYAAELAEMYSDARNRIRHHREADFQARKAANQGQSPAGEQAA